jgi:hypothetical protein
MVRKFMVRVALVGMSFGFATAACLGQTGDGGLAGGVANLGSVAESFSNRNYAAGEVDMPGGPDGRATVGFTTIDGVAGPPPVVVVWGRDPRTGQPIPIGMVRNPDHKEWVRKFGACAAGRHGELPKKSSSSSSSPKKDSSNSNSSSPKKDSFGSSSSRGPSTSPSGVENKVSSPAKLYPSLGVNTSVKGGGGGGATSTLAARRCGTPAAGSGSSVSSPAATSGNTTAICRSCLDVQLDPRHIDLLGNGRCGGRGLHGWGVPRIRTVSQRNGDQQQRHHTDNRAHRSISGTRRTQAERG